MSEADSNFLNAFQSMRKMFINVSKMLTSVSQQISQIDWIVPPRTSACGSSASSALYKPQHWLPEDAFQIYRNRNFLNTLIYCSVLFDDISNPELICAPLISTGVLQFEANSRGANGSFDYRWTRMALFNPYCNTIDGLWHDVELKKLDESKFYEVTTAAVRTIPLLNVTDEEKLSTDIVLPLKNKLNLVLKEFYPAPSITTKI